MITRNDRNRKWCWTSLAVLGVSIVTTAPAAAIFPPIFNTGATTVTSTPIVTAPTPPSITVPTPPTNPVTSVPVTTQGNPGSTVSVQGNPTGSQTPEPASLVLGLIGLATLGGRALRRRING